MQGRNQGINSIPQSLWVNIFKEFGADGSSPVILQHNHIVQYHIPTGKLIFFPYFFYTLLRSPKLPWLTAASLLGEEGVLPKSIISATSQHTNQHERLWGLPPPALTLTNIKSCPKFLNKRPQTGLLQLWVCTCCPWAQEHHPALGRKAAKNATFIEKSWRKGHWSNNPTKLKAAETKVVQKKVGIGSLHHGNTQVYQQGPHAWFSQAVAGRLTSPITRKWQKNSGVAFSPRHMDTSKMMKPCNLYFFLPSSVSVLWVVWEETVLFSLRKNQNISAKLNFLKK